MNVGRHRVIGLLALLLLLVSCSGEQRLSPAPRSVRRSAREIAELYLGARYGWGGQDFWWEEGCTVDCSGLIINIYKEAAQRHGYALAYEDATASQLHQQHTVPVATPEAGDVIFMGTDGVVSHIALFLELHEGQIHFIDAYSRSEIVEKRSYSEADERFISFGRMNLLR